MINNVGKIIFIAILVIVSIVVFSVLNYQKIETPDFSINSFEECAEAGYPILESYPRQCKTPDGETFIEDIGNELLKINLIRIENPRPNQTITSPLFVKGEARGNWFFEADFPVKLLDEENNLVVMAIATAQSDWMTEDFVPFEALLEFENPGTKKGILILEKDNPSGLPEHEDQLLVPVFFGR